MIELGSVTLQELGKVFNKDFSNVESLKIIVEGADKVPFVDLKYAGLEDIYRYVIKDGSGHYVSSIGLFNKLKSKINFPEDTVSFTIETGKDRITHLIVKHAVESGTISIDENFTLEDYIEEEE